MKVLFCNIAWMRDYHGSTSNDQPVNGGKYINEHHDGGEVYNFTHFNRNYYGYVYPAGDIHIERLEGVTKRDSQTENVLIVWMATKPESSGTYIVGWYKNATVYREMRELYVNDFSEYYEYNIKCDVKDAILLPIDKRTFVVPQATKVGKGNGKGQSNIWYAESADIRNDYLPKVFEYIDSYKEASADIIYPLEALTQPSGDVTCKTVDDFISLANRYNEEDKLYESLKCYNSAYQINKSCDICYARAEFLWEMGYCNESLNALKECLLFDEDTLDVEMQIAYRELILHEYTSAIRHFEIILKSLEQRATLNEYYEGQTVLELKAQICLFLAQAYTDLNQKSNAEKYLDMIIHSSDNEEYIKTAEKFRQEIQAVDNF